MEDFFKDAKVVTSADTRAKAVRALGLDEPPVTEKLSRSSFSSDEEYFDACTRLAVQNHDPAYRAEYTRIRREYNTRKAEEEAAALIEEMKKKYWDDRNNCSAFVLGERKEISRC